MSAMAERQGRSAGLAGEPVGPVLRRGGAAYLLSGLLAVTATANGLLTFLVPGVLHGTAVMNGSARGTALAVLLLGVPVLAVSMALARSGSPRAVVCWLGAVGFVLYNSVLFVFATPFNRLFLLDLAMLALAAWSAGVLLWQTDVAALGGLFTQRAPVRGVAVYVWVIATLNALVWLIRIVPALIGGGQAALLRGTGLPTHPVYVQDLALWLPLIAVAAVWLWRRRPWGYVLIGGALVMWVLESASIAVDQWYGHAADAASPVASAALTPAFGLLALIGLVPAYYLFRSLPGTTRGASRIPVAGRASAHGTVPDRVRAPVGAGRRLSGGPGPGAVDRGPDAGAAALPRHAASHRGRRGRGGAAGLAMAAGGSSARRVTGQAGPPPRSLTNPEAATSLVSGCPSAGRARRGSACQTPARTRPAPGRTG